MLPGLHPTNKKPVFWHYFLFSVLQVNFVCLKFYLSCRKNTFFLSGFSDGGIKPRIYNFWGFLKLELSLAVV
jgi:hypothetical protein